MRNALLLFFSLLHYTNCFSQSKANCRWEYDSLLQRKLVAFSEVMPEYPGGTAELMKFMSKNIKYPALDTLHYQEISGKLMFVFIVEANGEITTIGMLNKQKKDYTAMDREGIRVLQSMQKWTPAKCGNEKVPCKYVLPMRIHYSE